MLFKGVGKSGRDEIKSTGIQRGTENDACPTSAFSCSGVLIGRVDFHAFHFEMRSVECKRKDSFTVYVIPFYANAMTCAHYISIISKLYGVKTQSLPLERLWCRELQSNMGMQLGTV